MLPCQNVADHAGVPADPISTPDPADASRASDGSDISAEGVSAMNLFFKPKADGTIAWANDESARVNVWRVSSDSDEIFTIARRMWPGLAFRLVSAVRLLRP